MVVALFALSLVMVVGGIAAVIQGFPYVRLESGQALVFAGSIAVSAGVILLGLCAVVARLKRIEDSLDRVPAGGDLRGPSASVSPVAPVLPPMPDFGAAPPVAPPSPHDLRPALAGTAGLAGLSVGAAGLGAGLRGSAPVFEGTPPPVVAHGPAAREPAAHAEPDEPLLPDLLAPEEPPAPAAEPVTEPAVELRPETSEEDPFTRVPGSDEDALALRPSLREDVAEAASDPSAEPAPEPAVEEADPQVVGTYSSGGNTYVMYSTGIIEADTPNGRFTFNSLDELKAFVDSGGENQARGAA